MNDPDSLALARAQWRWRGKDRPAFAQAPKQGQISVWDFPRPPELVRDKREIVVHWGVTLVARTCGASQSMVQTLFHSLAGFMEAGSHQICLGHSKVSPTAATGKGYSSLVIKHCASPTLQPRA